MKKRTARQHRTPTTGFSVLFYKQQAAQQQREARRQYELAVLALQRPITQAEEVSFLLPAHLSTELLRAGRAQARDLNEILALFNTAAVLAHRVHEDAARDAIGAGILAIFAIRDRGGVRFAMNAEQRATVLQAINLADELFCCCTLLEINDAYRRVLELSGQGETRVKYVELDDIGRAA